ncbi:fructoselysine 6-kinase [Paenibacillus senegalensis]|uniref:fructoselysine 6-kinase n=1 Tax=Paenibacillus senegalensis TaxID=1465766 RepID=UPI0002896B40|nr:fructoselysine 6-kinase [Paenibacillus senegalensis]
MRIVGVGLSVIDIYDNLGKSYPAGNSVDFVIHLSRMGLPTSMISVVGDDPYGQQMIDLLQQEGVDASHMHIEKGRTATFTMTLNDNDRVHLEKVEGVMADFTLSEDDIRFIKQHDCVHTHFSGRVSHYVAEFKEAGLTTVYDYSTRTDSDAAVTLPHVDYAFLSYKHEDAFIKDYIKWTWQQGPRIVVATLGEQGSLAYDGKTFYKEGIVPAEVVNTVGAGDSYCAGFMHGVFSGLPVQGCMQQGAKLASSIVSRFKPY